MRGRSRSSFHLFCLARAVLTSRRETEGVDGEAWAPTEPFEQRRMLCVRDHVWRCGCTPCVHQHAVYADVAERAQCCGSTMGQRLYKKLETGPYVGWSE